jgi:hypothetical protein
MPKRSTTAEGKTKLSAWSVAYKLFGENFCQKLRDFPLEAMTQEKFTRFSKLVVGSPAQLMASSINSN